MIINRKRIAATVDHHLDDEISTLTRMTTTLSALHHHPERAAHDLDRLATELGVVNHDRRCPIACACSACLPRAVAGVAMLAYRDPEMAGEALAQVARSLRVRLLAETARQARQLLAAPIPARPDGSAPADRVPDRLMQAMRLRPGFVQLVAEHIGVEAAELHEAIAGRGPWPEGTLRTIYGLLTWIGGLPAPERPAAGREPVEPVEPIEMADMNTQAGQAERQVIEAKPANPGRGRRLLPALLPLLRQLTTDDPSALGRAAADAGMTPAALRAVLDDEAELLAWQARRLHRWLTRPRRRP